MQSCYTQQQGKGDRKGLHPTPPHPRPYKDRAAFVVVIVRAGVGWGGVETLAVALRL
jgi:hypothetical protein